MQTLRPHYMFTVCKECITMRMRISDEITRTFPGGGSTSTLGSTVQSKWMQNGYAKTLSQWCIHQGAIRSELSYLKHTSCSSSNMCSCNTLMHKSISLNSYGMFHPRGPNAHRSWTTAWKKHSPYSIFLKLSNCLQLSENSGSLIGYERYDLCSQEKQNQHCMSHP